MVVFICNHCGESLKKQVVEKHVWKCKREINVSCMDCLKDFPGKEYDAHTSCISETEKYSGKDYVPKPNANKGAKKQEHWVATIRSITETKRNLPKGIMAVFEVIQRNDNIPRKMKGFMNFFQNSAKYIHRADVEKAWVLIEEEVNRNKQQQQDREQKPTSASATEIEAPHGTATKRKAEENEPEQLKQKKQKKKESSSNADYDEESTALLNGKTCETNGSHEEDQNGNGNSKEGQKFRWSELIQSLLISKNNQMKLAKLKKKVLTRYRQFNGDDCDEQKIHGKFEKMFNKKILKPNIVIENDTVRLVE